jgi:formylglycine-generating enzyme required for sulfatase activity
MTIPRLSLMASAFSLLLLSACTSDKNKSPVDPGPGDTICTTNCGPDTSTTCTSGCTTTPGVAGQTPYTPIPSASYTGLTATIKEGANTRWFGMARVNSKGKSFQMGLKDSLYADDGSSFPSHKVTFTYSFYIEKTEVPSALVADVMDSALTWGWIRIDSVRDSASGMIHRSVFSTGTVPRKLFNIRSIGDASPVEHLDYRPRGDTGFVYPRLGLLPFDASTWYGAALYANAWSKIKGLEPVYDRESWVADYRRNGFRLPTEAEFEYAIRGGTTTTYFWNEDTWNSATAMRYGSVGELNDVNKGGLNPLGLYQVVSNANEWSDGWFAKKVSASEVDPVGPATGTAKGYRVGFLTSSGSRSGSRSQVSPTSSSGFRLVLPVR